MVVGFGYGSTPTWFTSSYAYAGTYQNASTSLTGYQTYSGTNGFDLLLGLTSSGEYAGFANINNFTASGDQAFINYFAGNAFPASFIGQGSDQNSNVKTALRIYATAGTITGTASLYGISS